MHPLVAVGIEGCWGMLFNVFLLPIYHYCVCPWDPNGAVFDDLNVWAY